MREMIVRIQATIYEHSQITMEWTGKKEDMREHDIKE